MYQSSLLLRTVLKISLTDSTSSAFSEYVFEATPDHFSIEGSPHDWGVSLIMQKAIMAIRTATAAGKAKEPMRK